MAPTLRSLGVGTVSVSSLMIRSMPWGDSCVCWMDVEVKNQMEKNIHHKYDRQ